jgi:hypothetical protein
VVLLSFLVGTTTSAIAQSKGRASTFPFLKISLAEACQTRPQAIFAGGATGQLAKGCSVNESHEQPLSAITAPRYRRA